MGGILAALRLRVMLSITSAICCFAATQASDLTVMQANGLTALWATNAILLSFLICLGRNRRTIGAICAGAFVASLLSGQLKGQPPELGILFGCANVVEGLAAFGILRLLGGSPGSLAKVHDVLALLAACVLAPIPSALLGAIGLRSFNGTTFLFGFAGWYVAAVLGLALVTPGAVTTIEFVARVRRRPPRPRQVLDALLVFGVVALMAVYVFYLAHQSTLFMLMPVVLLATFRLRQFGAVGAIGIIALIAATATEHGYGPIAHANIISHSGHIIYLQVFLAVIFASSLPVAAVLAERDARALESHLIADHFKAVVENSDDVIFRTDRAGRWTYLNPAWEALSGFPVTASIGRSWDDCIDPNEHREVADWAGPVFSGEVPATRRMLRFHTARGAVRWMELSIRALADKDGQVVGTTGTLRDVHDRKRLEEQVMSAKRQAEERERVATLLASTDELTGLHNRRAFLGRLDREIVSAHAMGSRLAVAIFDVDHFKTVNDSYGHAVGDRVLQRVASRAVGILRSGDLVGRIGGEEFAILMPGANLDDATAIAERLRAALGQRPGEGAERLPEVTVSVGIAALADGQTGAALLADADAALYCAKGAGRNRIKIAA